MIITPEQLDEYKESLDADYGTPKSYIGTTLYLSPNDLYEHISGNRHYKAITPYAKKLNDGTAEVTRLIRDIDKSLKDNADRIKRLAGSVNGVKYEVELRNLTSTLFNTKLSAIKAKMDFATQLNKSEKEDYKIAMQIAKDSGRTITDPNGLTTNNEFLADAFNSGSLTAKYNYNIAPIKPATDSFRTVDQNYGLDNAGGTIERVPYALPEKQVTDDVNITTARVQKPNNEDVPTETPSSMPVEAPESNLTHSVENTEQIPDIKEETSVTPKLEVQVAGELLNAMGKPITLYNEDGLDQFIKGAGPATDSIDYERSLVNIELEDNPNASRYFLYNKKDDEGYLITVNNETGDIYQKATNLPVEVLYPWTIDYSAGVVSTAIRENYPILLTDEPMPDDIKERIRIVKSREAGEVVLNEEDMEDM